MATLRPGPPDARAGGINSGRRYEDRREAEGGRCPGCCPESPISRPYKGNTKRTAKNGCPTNLRGITGGSSNAWNKLAGGAYYLAGGGPCIATDAETSSPLGDNTARSAGRRSCRAGRRHLQRRRVKVLSLRELMGGLQELMGRLQELMGRGPA